MAYILLSLFLFVTQVEGYENNIPPRYQWDSNKGYCGEVSLISAGLYYGQYISQYDARAIATDKPQNASQLLLGKNDLHAAEMMHLKALEWDTATQQTPQQFLAWIRDNVLKGYPVAIGVFTNEYIFYVNTDPDAGDSEYDHIVPVFGISDDTLTFSDNGLYGDESDPTYVFTYAFDTFPLNRQQANAENGPIYSLNNDGSNYGIAILGVKDTHGDTLPVRLSTNVNKETPGIEDKSNDRPTPMPLVLTITVSNLTPNVPYNLYRYNNLALVPNEQFNAHAKDACEVWNIEISSGSTCTMTESIQSDEIAVYRAVKASAP